MPKRATPKPPGLNVRFMQALEAVGLTGYGASKKLGTSEAVLSHIRQGKNQPNGMLVLERLGAYTAPSTV